MKKIFAYLAMFTAAATFVACENAPEGNVIPDATGKPIEITIGDTNRALLDLTDGKSVTWEAGDQIGLFHTVDGVVSENCKNAPYTADAAGATATFAGEATWGETAEGTHNFYVYYPYRSDKCDDPAALVKTLTNKQTYDVTGDWDEFGAKYSFAYAKVENVAYGGKVELPALKQLFCILRLNLTNNTGSDITISQVTVESDKTNIRRPYTIDITKDVATTEGEGTKLITCTVQNGTVANGKSVDIRVALGAEDYSNDTFTIVVTSDKGVHPAVTFTGKKLEQGERASKSITIEAAPTSAYKVGDVFNNEGVIFWIAPDNQSAKLVSPVTKKGSTINYASEVFTSPSEYRATDANDGTANVAKMKAYASANGKEFTSYFPAAAYCESLGEGWYLPAWSELKTIVAAYVGSANPSASEYDTLFKTDWATYATQRESFDNALKSITGGVGLAEGAGEIYVLCSTETGGGDKAKGIYFTQFKKSDGFAKYAKAGRAARCIKVVDLTK